jgi:hypothetical protein
MLSGWIVIPSRDLQKLHFPIDFITSVGRPLKIAHIIDRTTSCSHPRSLSMIKHNAVAESPAELKQLTCGFLAAINVYRIAANESMSFHFAHFIHVDNFWLA